MIMQGDRMSSLSVWLQTLCYAFSYTSMSCFSKAETECTEVSCTPSVSRPRTGNSGIQTQVLLQRHCFTLYEYCLSALCKSTLGLFYFLYYPWVGKQRPRKRKWIELIIILSYFTKVFLIKINVKGKQYMKVEVLLAQVSPTLCDPMDCSLPGSIVHGIL